MAINVDYISHLGSDLDVVNAARVSFDKESEWLCDAETGEIWENDDYVKDTKLIRYLSKHNHWSPFSHCYIKFRVKAPIFVARQLQKHTVGLAWNEVSRRYVDSEPEFFVPETWRKRADNVKQGSSEEAVDLLAFDLQGNDGASPLLQDTLGCYFSYVYEDTLELYRGMLKAGVCPEQARMVLPQSMMTEWIWSGSLMAFARVCQLRLDSHTQYETRLVAKQIAAHCQERFPVSWDALLGEHHGTGTV